MEVNTRGGNGVGPSDKKYDFESWAIYTFKDGKVVENVGLNDVWLFAMQMEPVKPPMAPASAWHGSAHGPGGARSNRPPSPE
ncbi:MAG: hypothetical protein ACYDA0_13470 [Candidatus Dormibacteraceae bacterium]